MFDNMEIEAGVDGACGYCKSPVRVTRKPLWYDGDSNVSIQSLTGRL